MDRRRLPSVDQLVSELGEWPLPRSVLAGVARAVLAEARAGNTDLPPAEAAARRARQMLATRLGRVINATGVLLHTNLGRAPLAPVAAEAAAGIAAGYGNLELDLGTGARGKRGAYVHDLLAHLSGAEAALVVNNNAAALVLAVAAFAAGREVVVSRGELIEIGGSYRLPNVIVAGGARLREVGTTNRTRLADYAEAINPETGAILRVHPSNYRIVGFSEAPELLPLVELAREANVPLVFDAGSGLLDAQVPWLSGPPPSWIGAEPGVRQAVATGADLVLFSGDKLFGGPQAGIVVGRRDLLARLLQHPLARAFRVDGPRLGALASTAELYAHGLGAQIPLWAMATASYVELERRAEEVLRRAQVRGHIEESASAFGGGSLPGAGIPSPVIVIERAEAAFVALLRHQPPVLARRESGRLVLDLRAVAPEDDAELATALAAACR